jgi:hypothetical protein
MTVIIIEKFLRSPEIFNDLNQDHTTSLICICLIITKLYFPVNQPATKIVIHTIDVQIIGKLLANSSRIW